MFGGAGLIKPFKGRLKVLEKLMHQVVDTSNDNGGNVVKLTLVVPLTAAHQKYQNIPLDLIATSLC